ncbi:MAG: phage Gp37/Gp68 family protein [Sphingobium sp.]|nr:phage Gp37/Gp68 family protein [Sphingobium sp.]
MADGTKIEWTDATWNVINGCSVVSPGCKHCYAMRLAGTRLRNVESREGLTVDTKAGPVWNGTTRFNDKVLLDPIRWKRPRRIFVCAHGDLFHDSVPDAWIDHVFAIMALAPQHQFQVLTKRAWRMRQYLSDPKVVRRICNLAALFRYACTPDPDRRPRAFQKLMRQSAQLTAWTREGGGAAKMFARQEPDRDYPSWVPWPLPNVWLGVSAENQHWLMDRAPHLVETPAAVRFISYEPALDAIDVEPFVLPVRQWANMWANNYPYHYPKHRVDWIICGGENGPRPMHPDWARSVRDQCAQGGVAFFFKQWGSYLPAGQVDANGRLWNPACGSSLRAIKSLTGRLLDGVTHDGMPT